jgi:hypothetical protein
LLMSESAKMELHLMRKRTNLFVNSEPTQVGLYWIRKEG